MKICIPVNEDKGIQSTVSGHFGSAPLFLIVETDDGSCRAIPNRNDHQSHGSCMPLESFRGETFDGLIVGGIGMGALMKLSAAGLAVFRSDRATVSEIVADAKAGRLQRMSPDLTCGGQSGGGCGHDHT